MKTVIIVQARMGSTRLPGKVMKKIVGIPAIGIILKRLKKSKEAEKVIVATSKKKENRILLEYLRKIKTSYFCGSENDVLNRFYKAAGKYKAKIHQPKTPWDDQILNNKFIQLFIPTSRIFKSKERKNLLPLNTTKGVANTSILISSYY